MRIQRIERASTIEWFEVFSYHVAGVGRGAMTT
jgi:hypothetical protein